VIDAAELAALEIADGLDDLGLSVHDERPIARDGFVEGDSAKQQDRERLTAAVAERDAVAVGGEEEGLPFGAWNLLRSKSSVTVNDPGRCLDRIIFEVRYSTSSSRVPRPMRKLARACSMRRSPVGSRTNLLPTRIQ